MDHALAPIHRIIAIAMEGRLVLIAEGTNCSRWKEATAEVRSGVRDPHLEVRRIEAQIAACEEEFAWQVVAIVIVAHGEMLNKCGWNPRRHTD